MTSVVDTPPKKSVWDWFVLAIATGFFVGLIPPRTATTATLWGIPLALALHAAVGWSWYIPILIGLWVMGIWICERGAALRGGPDPREITYDEITTLPLVYFHVPAFTAPIIVAGFVLHRIFDIIKPFGIRRLERLGGGLGIMADDVVAAIVAWVALRALLWYHVVG